MDGIDDGERELVSESIIEQEYFAFGDIFTKTLLLLIFLRAQIDVIITDLKEDRNVILSLRNE